MVSQQYRGWSDSMDVKADLALFWWQRLITFGSSRRRVKDDFIGIWLCTIYSKEQLNSSNILGDYRNPTKLKSEFGATKQLIYNVNSLVIELIRINIFWLCYNEVWPFFFLIWINNFGKKLEKMEQEIMLKTSVLCYRHSEVWNNDLIMIFTRLIHSALHDKNKKNLTENGTEDNTDKASNWGVRAKKV